MIASWMKKTVIIADNQNSLKATPRGPTLLEDFILREKITHFDHERIPERIVHARGSGAHGCFEVTESAGDRREAHKDRCLFADPLQEVGLCVLAQRPDLSLAANRRQLAADAARRRRRFCRTTRSVKRWICSEPLKISCSLMESRSFSR